MTHEHPNLVVVILDTARGLDTVPPDPEWFPTMTALAEAGTEFRRAFASAPWTLPSHAGALTGTYTSRHGTHGDHPYLDDSLATLPELLTEAGYETRAISNNTWFSDEFGFDRGFDRFYNAWSPADDEPDGIRFDDGESPDEWRERATYAGARATTDLALDWLDSMDEGPSLLVLNYLDPHFEYAPPPAYVRDVLPPGYDYGRAIDLLDDPRAYDAGATTLTDAECAVLRTLYRGELAYLDANLGRLVAGLRAANRWEETVLVVTGDHGENIGDHGFVGHQYNLYDTLLHVPLIVTGGAFAGGTPTDRLVQLTDLAPTLLDAAGIEAPAARGQFQGRSFHPDASAPERASVIAEHIAPRPPIETLQRRYGELPPALASLEQSLPLRTIRTAEDKLILGADGTRELYHVETDPMETVDVADRRPAVADGLEADLDGWLASFDSEFTRASTDISAECEDRLRDLGYL